jgi:predicted nucleic acid-binding protein
MGWVDGLRGNIVGLDTAPFIYSIEKNPQYINTVRTFFQAVDAGEFTVVTSMLTLLEVLVIPLRKHDEQLVQQYRERLFHTKGLKTLQISEKVLESSAQIRADHPGIRTPDAIHLATAIEAKASFFLTNDAKLLNFPGIQVLVLSQLGS